MIETTGKYTEKINSIERYIDATVRISGKEYGTDRIRSFKYQGNIGDNGFAIGSVNASTVEIVMDSLIEGLQTEDEVGLATGVKDEPLIPLGVFFLTEIKPDRNSNVTILKAADKMIYLNGKYVSKLQYPAQTRDVVNEICTTVGIEWIPSFVGGGKVISNAPKECTYREMLSYVAQIENSFVIFDRQGRLSFRKLQRNDARITKDQYFVKGLEVNDIDYKVDGISVDLKQEGEDKIIATGSATGNQLRLTNPFMTQNYLDTLHSEIKGIAFKPFKLKWRGNPAIEVGDWVQVESYDDHYIGVPVLNLSIEFNGGLRSDISADVKPIGATTYEYKGTLQKQIEFLDARIGADGTRIYADVIEPKDPKEGDSWFKPNGAYTDLYIFENGKWELKVSTGNVEELVTKITEDEILAPRLVAAIAKIIELDAKSITSGELRAGIIKDQTGLNSWNLETGEFNLNGGNVNINAKSVTQKVSDEVRTQLSDPDIHARFKGDDGTGISKTTIEYASSKITTPPSSFTGQMPTIEDGDYLWTKTTWYYTDGNMKTGYSVSKVGRDGADGTDGKKGRGVKEIVNLYYLSDSRDKLIGGDWIETQPNWEQGKHIWTKQRILFDDNTETETNALLLEPLNNLLEDSEAVKQELETITSEFTQTAESVVMGIVSNYSKITDLENLKAEITNQLITDKNGFNFEFKSLEEKLTHLGKEVSLQKKWIRLVDGEIHMGRDDSPIDTVYTNKSLEFRYNGTTVAQFTNDVLTVRNIEVKNQLKLTDNWAIRPGAYITDKGYNLDDVWLGGEV